MSLITNVYLDIHIVDHLMSTLIYISLITNIYLDIHIIDH